MVTCGPWPRMRRTSWSAQTKAQAQSDLTNRLQAVRGNASFWLSRLPHSLCMSSWLNPGQSPGLHGQSGFAFCTEAWSKEPQAHRSRRHHCCPLHKPKKSPTVVFCKPWKHSLHCPWPFDAILDLQIHGEPARHVIKCMKIKVSVLEVARLWSTGFQVFCAKILNVAHHVHQGSRNDHGFHHCLALLPPAHGPPMARTRFFDSAERWDVGISHPNLSKKRWKRPSRITFQVIVPMSPNWLQRHLSIMGPLSAVAIVSSWFHRRHLRLVLGASPSFGCWKHHTVGGRVAVLMWQLWGLTWGNQYVILLRDKILPSDRWNTMKPY